MNYSDFKLKYLNRYQNESVEENYNAVRHLRKNKVIVLDDDPTGIQTVHGINVYYTWEDEIIKHIIRTEQLTFIQTNTRSLPAKNASEINELIATKLLKEAKQGGVELDIISRSDSTLRGHYPNETETIRKVYKNILSEEIDGEILVPFFGEGGRFTFGDIHYVKIGDKLIPASETEFAKDPDFGFHSSNMKAYIEEKTKGKFKALDVESISLELLQKRDLEKIINILLKCSNFSKVVVNAVCYDDLKVFVTAIKSKKLKDKRFIFRTSASFIKAYCHVSDQAYLDSGFFATNKNYAKNGNLFIVGSYTEVTTNQLTNLLKQRGIIPLELDVAQIIAENQTVIDKTISTVNNLLRQKKNPIIYTSRKLIVNEPHLVMGQLISNTLVAIVRNIAVRPNCLVTKGGITSSEIISRGVNIKRALIAGQVLPGVPVVVSNKDAKWDGLPCIIFPGNVGDPNALARIYGMIKNA